jgi:hypothetical protein
MEDGMDTRRGDLSLLEHPVARDLLSSAIPVRLAYIALDGTPRVVPLLFHWTGVEVVVVSWPDDPKVAALQSRPDVALTIDSAAPPFQVLSLRGVATVELVDGVPHESLLTFTRYFGPEQGPVWTARTAAMSPQTARIAVRPSWVDVLDFETRFPGGMTRRMQAMNGAKP